MPRPGSVTIASLPNSLRKAPTCAPSSASATAAPGQARATRSLRATTLPPRSTSAINTSSAGAASGTPRPSASNRRARGCNSMRPKRQTSSVSAERSSYVRIAGAMFFSVCSPGRQTARTCCAASAWTGCDTIRRRDRPVPGVRQRSRRRRRRCRRPDDHVAEVHTDAKRQPADASCPLGVAARPPDRDRRRDGCDRAVEYGEHRVTGSVDDAAATSLDLGRNTHARHRAALRSRHPQPSGANRPRASQDGQQAGSEVQPAQLRGITAW
jgi:hypothetical protein